MADIRFTVLVEDTTDRADVAAEHGLSIWIETGDRRILFDTGQSDMLLRNAGTLGIDLRTADAVVLSHGHYDHVGGLEAVWGTTPAAPVYLHPDALAMKFGCNGQRSRSIGMEPTATEMLKQRIESGLGSYTSGPAEILPGVWVTGEVPRRWVLEDTGGPFYADAECHRPDPLLDDQALVLEAGDGLVVLLGCAHAGVINTLDYVCELFPDRRIHTVAGGMHLLQASRSRLAQTIERIQRYGIERIGPAHCTGGEATEALRHAMPRQWFACRTGTQVSFRQRARPRDGNDGRQTRI